MKVGQKVRVHYNRNAKNFTVQEYIKGVGWRKCAAVDDIVLHDVEFKVSQAGRQRCVREGKRNVHAYAEGTVRRLDCMQVSHFVGYTPLRYNPYEAGSFIADAQPIHGAASVVFSTKHGTLGWGLICNS